MARVRIAVQNQQKGSREGKRFSRETREGCRNKQVSRRKGDILARSRIVVQKSAEGQQEG